MSTHSVSIEWERRQSSFVDNRYSRAHRWRFDGGAEVLGSSSPHVVRVPWSDPAGVDPEEALVASVSSCHMLWFLSIAAGKGYVVDRYVDHAQGHMETGANGKQWVSRVELAPEIVFAGEQAPSDEILQALHHQAHEECFIANSIKAEITVDHSRWTHRP